MAEDIVSNSPSTAIITLMLGVANDIKTMRQITEGTTIMDKIYEIK